MNKIKELRKENNITVAELAKELGISQSMLTNYENGNGTPRDDSIWDRLSQTVWRKQKSCYGIDYRY